ncbi:MAG: hypothetical protein KHX36_02575 [Clostridiales bacterium]|nr:hypothetical protein [Clostridiales bacterium]
MLSDLEPTDAAAPAARGRLSRECARCRACLRACPTGALNGDGTIQAERCLRNFSYSEPIPEGMRPLFGVSLYGCDVCQRVCPRNAGQRAVEPPEELRRALSLKALLQGEYKPLAPFIGANYARRNRVMGRAGRQPFAAAPKSGGKRSVARARACGVGDAKDYGRGSRSASRRLTTVLPSRPVTVSA